MGRRIAAAVDAAAPAGKPAASRAAGVALITATAASRASTDSDASSETSSEDQISQMSQIADGESEVGADVHIDHLSLAASIQMQAEGLFRMPPQKKKRIDDLQVGGSCLRNWAICLWCWSARSPESALHWVCAAARLSGCQGPWSG